MKRRTFLTLVRSSLGVAGVAHQGRAQSTTEMNELWVALEDWLGQQLPEVLADLNSGCSNEELSDLERRLNCTLPKDFKAFYRHHNGQKGETTGLFFGLPFLSTNDLYEQWSTWRDLAQEDFATSITGESYPSGAIKPTYINLRWIPFAYDGGGNHLGVDLAPGPAGVAGQVINFGRDEDNKFVLASSLTELIAWLIAQYQAGNYRIDYRPDIGWRSLDIKEPPFDHFLDAVPLLFGRG